MGTLLDQEEKQFREVCLDLAVNLTGMGLGMWVENSRGEGDLTITPTSRRHFEGFCQYMHRDPNRLALCNHDHTCRASSTSSAGLQMCHAGLFNYSVAFPAGQRKIVLIGGQTRIEGREAESEQRFNEFAERMRLPDEEREEFRRRLREAKMIRLRHLNWRLARPLRLIGQWYGQYLQMRRAFEESISNVAHEFLIHVSALHIMADLLCQDLDTPGPIRREMREDARELKHNIARLRDVVSNHLLDYQEEPRFERRTIGPVIHDAVEVYTGQAREKGVRFDVDLELVNNRSPEIEMAEGHLRRALHNLVQNAVKYSFHGLADRDRVVRVLGRVQSRGHTEGYLISVENFGVGIDEDEYALIFKRGYQGRRTKDEYRPGSGNGLYFTNQMIRLHHGHIAVTSTDKGSAFLTRFDVWLPYAQPKEA